MKSAAVRARRTAAGCEQPVINRGFGGSYTAGLTDYADRILIPLKPRGIALLPGSNKLVAGGKNPEQVLADFPAFVTKVRVLARRTNRLARHQSQPGAVEHPRTTAAHEPTHSRLRADRQKPRLPGPRTASIGSDGQAVPDHFIADQLHPSRQACRLRSPIIRPFF